jgi:hypothetical protein
MAEPRGFMLGLLRLRRTTKEEGGVDPELGPGTEAGALRDQPGQPSFSDSKISLI